VGDVWGDTRLVLPAEWAPRTFRDVLTGRRVSLDRAADAPPGLLLSSVFSACPVALLWSTASSG
jgi:hypothetical protein